VPGRLRPSTLKDRLVGNKGVNALQSLFWGIPTIPIRQRSTELTPKSGGLGYGKSEHPGLNFTAFGFPLLIFMSKYYEDLDKFQF